MNDKLVSQYNKRYAVSLLIMLLLYCFFTATSLLGPHYISVFIDEIVESASPSVIPVFLAKYGSVVILCTITALLIKIIISKMENEILMDLRCTLFSKLISQPLSYFRVNSFGAVSEKILRDTNVVHSLWGYLIPSICSSVIVLVFTLFVILRKSPLIALLSIPSILIYVWVFRVFNGKLRQLFLNAREDADKVNNTMTDAWNGIQDLKIFHLQSWIFSKFSDYNKQLKTNNFKMQVNEELSKQLMFLSSVLGNVVTLCIGGYLVLSHSMSIGTLVALQAYVGRLYEPAQNLADMAIDYRKYMVNIKRIEELYTLDDSPSFDINALPVSFPIRFSSISFRYDLQPVLSNINLSLASKGIIAIVGKSGVGKTTLINLLVGLETPASGNIYYDNEDVTSSFPHIIGPSVSLVSQHTYIFPLSLLDNIKIGNPNASDEDISRVLSLLDIDSIASKMPDGYDSIISEKGKNLSSGQIQRIAIARAILKPSSILILDEATSNVDSTSELIIQNSLNTLKQEKLIIIISHRLSSIKNADTIYVMSDGTFCQSGPFDKLASTDGCFKDLFAEQLYDHSI